MHTWKSIALAAAIAMTLNAYADDRTSTSAQSTTKSTSDTRPGSSTSSMPDKPMSGSSTSTRTSDHAHGTSSAMANDPELQNLDNEKFFKLAAASGMKEVEAAELALRNSKNEQVRDFAREMISDHTKQNTELTNLAAQNDVKIDKELPAKEKADIEKLRAATGTTFDTAYTKQMKTDHQKAVALFQSCANSNKVAADVRSFCKTNLSTLEEHHQAANNLDSRSRTTRSAAADE